jgi:hypothetical protein
VLASSWKVVEVRNHSHDVDFAAENETNESNNASAEDDLTPLVSNNSSTP